jgi:hypothetical protein
MTRSERAPRWVVAIVALALAALACVDVLDLTESSPGLDLTRAPHLGAVRHVTAKPTELTLPRGLRPTHAGLPPSLVGALLLALVGLVALPRADVAAGTLRLRPRLRGPPPLR